MCCGSRDTRENPRPCSVPSESRHSVVDSHGVNEYIRCFSRRWGGGAKSFCFRFDCDGVGDVKSSGSSWAGESPGEVGS